MKNIYGFTLIELMITILIISILVAITIPVYQQYVQKTSERVCLQELKAYANLVYTNLNDQDKAKNDVKPLLSACSSITDASNWNIDTANKILTGIPKHSSAKKSQCDLNISASCVLVP
ncbi:prepilin-type N-terminal cleavage/methylation domain-containing protein [Acinetobacter johnsonii]|nr:prepilin-type N-terminal cleavage/methylation domain-containing protein [Acinetobacter johnsonii]